MPDLTREPEVGPTQEGVHDAPEQQQLWVPPVGVGPPQSACLGERRAPCLVPGLSFL